MLRKFNMCLLCSITPASFLVFVSIFSLFSWFFFCSFFFFSRRCIPGKNLVVWYSNRKGKREKGLFSNRKIISNEERVRSYSISVVMYIRYYIVFLLSSLFKSKHSNTKLLPYLFIFFLNLVPIQHHCW